MGFRLKTSKQTKEYFDKLCASSSLKPFALCKIAIALSLNEKAPITEYPSDDMSGMELQRATVTGEHDIVYKALLEMNLGRHLTDDDYFPKYMKLHIDRGTEILYKKYQYAGGSLEKFITLVLKEGDVL